MGERFPLMTYIPADNFAQHPDWYWSTDDREYVHLTRERALALGVYPGGPPPPSAPPASPAPRPTEGRAGEIASVRDAIGISSADVSYVVRKRSTLIWLALFLSLGALVVGEVLSPVTRAADWIAEQNAPTVPDAVVPDALENDEEGQPSSTSVVTVPSTSAEPVEPITTTEPPQEEPVITAADPNDVNQGLSQGLESGLGVIQE